LLHPISGLLRHPAYSYRRPIPDLLATNIRLKQSPPISSSASGHNAPLPPRIGIFVDCCALRVKSSSLPVGPEEICSAPSWFPPNPESRPCLASPSFSEFFGSLTSLPWPIVKKSTSSAAKLRSRAPSAAVIRRRKLYRRTPVQQHSENRGLVYISLGLKSSRYTIFQGKRQHRKAGAAVDLASANPGDIGSAILQRPRCPAAVVHDRREVAVATFTATSTGIFLGYVVAPG
jgi:hypothetical protein